MRSQLLVFAASMGLLGSATTGAEAQQIHEIRLNANPEKDVYRFSPARVDARPGDVLLFKTVSGSPHSIVFEGATLSAPAREALNGSMARRTGDLSSPVLSPNGAEYRIVVPALPPGRYEFFCLPHRAYDMRGVLQVEK